MQDSSIGNSEHSEMGAPKQSQFPNATSSNGTPLSADATIREEEQHGRFRGCFSKAGCVRQNTLTLMTILGVIIGIIIGFSLHHQRKWSKREIMYMNFIGEVFLNMLKALILPLIISSLISAVGNMDISLSGKIGARAIVYYFVTTILAIILGIVLVISIKPGAGDSGAEHHKKANNKPSTTVDTFMDLVRNMFPPNLIEACFKQRVTHLIKPANATNTSNKYEWPIKAEKHDGMNILGILVFSIVFGITIARMGEAGRPLRIFFSAFADAMMIITTLVIWLSPLGVMFLVASKIMEMEDFSLIAGKVGMYTLTVLCGLFLHALITLPILYFIFVRHQPFSFIARMSQALATAFGTSSSSATLPVTIACLEQKNNIDPRISRFCLPIGATINMDGTALYEAVAAIFIAQIKEVPLSFGSIVAISITATAASIGAAGIPQAGLVTMVMVLNVVGLPADDVAYILLVDWFLDRFRTAVNVLGDAIGSGIVAHLSKKDLEELDAMTTGPPKVEMTAL